MGGTRKIIGATPRFAQGLTPVLPNTDNYTVRKQTKGAAGMAKIEGNGSERPRISLCMIAKNEARFLRNCLQSVQGIADEIVLVDTGSTDGTQAIAREFGALVIEREWTDDFAEARNVSLRHATGDWALWLDADEEIAPEARDEFRKSVENAPATVGAFLVRICNWMSGLTREADGERFYHHAARLFRLTPDVHFVGRIHEQNMSSLLKAGFTAVSAPQLVLDHFGYVQEIKNEKQKNERTIRMLSREVAECPIPELRDYQLFNLGLAYNTAGDYENAAKYFGMAAERPDVGQEHTVFLFAQYAGAQYCRDLPEDGLKICARADALGLRHPGLEYARAQCCRHLGRLPEAEAAFRAALRQGAISPHEQAPIGDSSLGGYKARFGLALTLADLERWEDALAECELSLAEREAQPAAHLLKADLLARRNRLADAEICVRRALELEPGRPEIVRALGFLLLENGQAEAAGAYLQNAAEAFPDDGEVFARLAQRHELLGKTDEAVAAYSRLREISPDSAEVSVNLGRLLAQKGDVSAALNCFADAIEINPGDANAYFNAGDALYGLKNYGQASELYRAGLALRADYGAGHFTLGNCRFRQGDFAAAARSYRAALRFDPCHEAARRNLALLDENENEAVAA